MSPTISLSKSSASSLCLRSVLIGVVASVSSAPSSALRVAVSRRWGNRVGSRVLSRVCGQPIPDSQCGFRLLSRPALEAILPVLPGGRYETESVMLILAARRGFRIASVPVRLIPARAPSTSHFRLLRDSIRVGLALARHGVGGAGRP